MSCLWRFLLQFDTFSFRILLAGVYVCDFGRVNADKLRGVFLFAAYLTRPNKLRDYPVPVMTISGDLDGLTRVTRITDTFE